MRSGMAGEDSRCDAVEGNHCRCSVTPRSGHLYGESVRAALARRAGLIFFPWVRFGRD